MTHPLQLASPNSHHGVVLHSLSGATRNHLKARRKCGTIIEGACATTILVIYLAVVCFWYSSEFPIVLEIKGRHPVVALILSDRHSSASGSLSTGKVQIGVESIAPSDGMDMVGGYSRAQEGINTLNNKGATSIHDEVVAGCAVLCQSRSGQ